MGVWRRLVATVVVLFVLASLGVSARGQFGNLLKKALPKPATAGMAPQKLYCQDITAEQVERLVEGLKAERAAHERAQASDRAAKGIQAANDEAAGKRMMDAMEERAACEQAAQEKDSRFKEAERLSDLRNKAQDRGDDAAADKYGEQYAALTDALEQVARTACTDPNCLARARASSAHHTMIAELRASAAREKDPSRKTAIESQIAGYLGMIETEAELTCSAMAAAAPSADEQAASAAAAEAARKAKEGKEDDAAKTADMTKEEYQRLKECAIGALNNPAATPITADSQKAFDQRADLGPALKAAGH